MKIISFADCNVKLMGQIPAAKFEQGGLTCFITCWQPSEADLKELKKGKPIFLQVYKEMTPTIMYTVNEEGKPNI